MAVFWVVASYITLMMEAVSLSKTSANSTRLDGTTNQKTSSLRFIFWRVRSEKVEYCGC
jgi:hypothetical protein